LRNTNTAAPPDITVGGFGAPGDKPLVGDWVGNFALQSSVSSAVWSCDAELTCGAVSEITVAPLGGFARPVSLSVELVSQIGYSHFWQNPVTPGAATHLLIESEYWPPVGTYRATVVGTSGTLIAGFHSM
jgi:hypothetical protein